MAFFIEKSLPLALVKKSPRLCLNLVQTLFMAPQIRVKLI